MAIIPCKVLVKIAWMEVVSTVAMEGRIRMEEVTAVRARRGTAMEMIRTEGMVAESTATAAAAAEENTEAVENTAMTVVMAVESTVAVGNMEWMMVAATKVRRASTTKTKVKARGRTRITAVSRGAARTAITTRVPVAPCVWVIEMMRTTRMEVEVGRKAMVKRTAKAMEVKTQVTVMVTMGTEVIPGTGATPKATTKVVAAVAEKIVGWQALWLLWE